MTKKVLAGFLVGGAAAFGAWQSLSADKKKQIKQAVADKTHDAVDYAINALDLADGMVQDVKEQAVDKFGDKFSDLAGSVKKGADTVKKSADQAVNHFTNDDFDEQTAQIREELAKAQSDTSSQDDIVIDKTADASDEDNDAASQDDHSSSSNQD